MKRLQAATRGRTLAQLLMRISVHGLVASLLIATIGAAAATASLDLVDPGALAASHVSSPDQGPAHGELHLDAFECEVEEETEKACCQIGLRSAALVPRADAGPNDALRLHPTCPLHPIDPIAAHAPRGPPCA